jgi:hypothetical protein
VPVVVRHPGEEPVASQPRVVDEDVEVARLVDEPLRLLRVRHVGLNRPASALACDLLGFLGSAVVADDDARAGARELEGDGAADSARSTGDECGLAVERRELRQR